MQKGSGLALACRPLVFSGGVAQQASGRRVALGPRVGPPLCPGQAGAGLCFLPQNFLGGPPNPAYQYCGYSGVTILCVLFETKLI